MKSFAISPLVLPQLLPTGRVDLRGRVLPPWICDRSIIKVLAAIVTMLRKLIKIWSIVSRLLPCHRCCIIRRLYIQGIACVCAPGSTVLLPNIWVTHNLLHLPFRHGRRQTTAYSTRLRLFSPHSACTTTYLELGLIDWTPRRVGLSSNRPSPSII